MHYDGTNLEEMLFVTMHMSAVDLIDPTVVISLFFSDPFELNRLRLQANSGIRATRTEI